ncbi:MAG TPA: efflux RND transporter permease subunit, partial [Bacteroidales bacterium]|nr:efflux RND transporter permease subunit [Bacteroidales bacterium]
PESPVPVDALPDIGENQQIVSTEWMGRSPRDIQDQVTYPLTTALLGIPGVQTIRSSSMFGMSFIYIIFNDNVEFYWSRSRILEKLNSLPPGTLPAGVQPSLGPDATALGQVFWYTLEGRDPKTGLPAGGWDPQELRAIQDYYVKYSLSAAEGVAEVASAGGFVKEYQVDLDPDALRAFNVSVRDVMHAVQSSNLDIGAETIELNYAEYLIRGLGYVKSLEDLEYSVVAVRNNIPVRIRDIARVSFGPSPRRGGLDKSGSEAVGGVVVARYRSNPWAVIGNVKDRIAEVEAGLPQKILPDGTVSKVTIVPFYDRTGLIRETIGTLETALSHEILISIIVILVLLLNLRASLIVSGLLPAGVLMTFILMRLAGIEANIVALSGIAIAIGVMVDIGIVDVENILRHLEMPENRGVKGERLLKVIYEATVEVRGAVVTSVSTTIVSFLPVFAMQAQEGKLFHPLAFTKTFALLSAFILGIVILPTLVYLFFNITSGRKTTKKAWNFLLIASGLIIAAVWQTWPALALTAAGINNLLAGRWSERRKNYPGHINIAIVVLFALWYLAKGWLPLGPHNSQFVNFLFVAGIVAVILLALMSLVRYYENIMGWALKNKLKFLLIPGATLLFGWLAWMGFDRTFGFIAGSFEKAGWKKIRQTALWQGASGIFPGAGKEFMPALDEGSFLLMPTSMPHTGIEKNLEYIEILDRRVAAIPEVEAAVGKWGRVNSALDPAPVQMFENTINYRPEYILDENGRRMRFRTDRTGSFILKGDLKYNSGSDKFRLIPADSLIPDRKGDFFRQWRPEIKSPDDIWKEIVKATAIPGLTSAPKLQPIETRLVMLSTGMRAPMGLKVYGPDLEAIEHAGLQFEKALKDVPSVNPSTVFYDRAVGAPYIEIRLRREAMARYGITVSELQEVLQVAVGGMSLTTSVEGRERFPLRVRYARELRDNPEDLGKILIPAAGGIQVPLGAVADIDYTKGAQMIQSENTFLVGYVIFDKHEGKAEVDVVNEAAGILRAGIDSGDIELPPGVSYKFAGNYEHQIRATKRLSVVIPLSLIIILFLLYQRFRTITASFIHFSGVFVAFAGGFIMLWLYGQDWFMNFNLAGMNMRELFQMHTINLSVAVWVGFIALFGIATNDGVLMGTYIHQIFEERQPATVNEVRKAVLDAGKKRVRPAMMTTAVAVIALLPVLSSTGKGSDIMVPMAIPAFGGMLIQVMTIFVVPLFQAIWRETEINKSAAPGPAERIITEGTQ